MPTLYEVIGITPPKVVDGFGQDPIDGVSLAYTFADAKAPDAEARPVLRQQRQPRHLPGRLGRGDLRSADAVAARRARPREWDSAKDKWELYDIARDFSEADDLAAKEPQRLAQLQKTFDQHAVANKVYPLGAGIWLRLHPEDRIKTPYTSWQFDATTTRMPEFTAPGIGHENNTSRSTRNSPTTPPACCMPWADPAAA